MGRAPCCDKAIVKQGPWSPEEDAKLKGFIERHGTGGNWIALPRKIGLKRCGKSCRLRWLNYLRPNIKHGGFTEEEDQIICSLYISIGSRWSIIAAQLPGRTDNDIKNYWNTRLKKKLLGKRREPVLLQSHQQLHRHNQNQAPNLRASALERMQLQLGLRDTTPFSFFNNPALWSKHHPLGDTIFQDKPSTDAIATTPVHKPNSDATEIDLSISANIQEEAIEGSALGFYSPSLSSNLELQDLVYCNESSVEGHEEHELVELDCYKEIYGEGKSANWWPTDDLVHSNSMIQDYAMQ